MGELVVKVITYGEYKLETLNNLHAAVRSATKDDPFFATFEKQHNLKAEKKIFFARGLFIFLTIDTALVLIFIFFRLIQSISVFSFSIIYNIVFAKAF